MHIVDTGKGINPAKKERMNKALGLEPPVNTGSLLINPSDESGESREIEMGLLTCKKILHNSGGTLQFHSDGENRGSTFVFSIKMNLPDSQTPAILEEL